MNLYIGIDAGGTRSEAVAIDEQRNERAREAGAPALLDATNAERTATDLADLARRTAGKAGGDVAALCCAVAGAGREEQRAELEAALRRINVAPYAIVITDSEAAMHDAFGDGPGILLIAGTGSIAWGRAADGRTARVGGWGALLGDEGSGYAIGLAALRAVARAHDGRARKTRLRDTVLNALALGSPEALIPWAARAGKKDVAALAPRVLHAASQGDAAADAIARRAAAHLARHVTTLARQLGPWPERPALALAGGLLAPTSHLRPLLLPRLPLDHLHLHPSPIDPARGAATRALTLTLTRTSAHLRP